MRHLVAYWEGEDIDPACGLPHIIKIMACCVVLRDAQIAHKYYDDRPPRIALPAEYLNDLETKVKELSKKYPNSKEPFTEENTKGNK
jgi:hypothetical protein